MAKNQKSKMNKTATANETATESTQKDYTLQGKVPAAQIAQAGNDIFTMDSAELAGLETVGLPPFVNLKSMPVGAIVKGTIEKVVASPVKEYKNNPILIMDVRGNRVSFPASTVIVTKLEITGGDDGYNSPFIGRMVAIKKNGEKPSKRFSGKSYNVFDVFTEKA